MSGKQGESWRKGKTTAQRGYGNKWQQARKGYLRKHPLCRMCEAKGLIVAATVVDHIKPHRGDMKVFWNSSNWQPLCKLCHDSDKARAEYTRKHYQRIDDDGWPTA